MSVDPLFIAFQQAPAGRYSIDRELGRGGMGIVYLAREVHLDRLVAIKLLPPALAADDTLRERFLREARLAAKLSHPNIIPIHAVDEAGEFVFYVMAYVDGETLANRVRARGPLGTSEGARVLRDVAWALGHAHANGLVHRDVKPENILIEASSGRVFVADFGIAAAVHDVATGTASGTPEFMSPEQALGKEVDPRSDLYSLGVTAFYGFTGRLPFEGKSATQVLAKQVTAAAPSVASTGANVSRKLSAMVDQCLAKDPAARPADANALADQLSAMLEQRKEVPAALRAFVKRDSRLNGGGTMLMPFLMLLLAIFVASYAGVGAGVASAVIGMITFAFTALIVSARRLLKLGFDHRDVAPAFSAEIEQALDERSHNTRSRALRSLERGLGLGAAVCGGVVVGGSTVAAVLANSGDVVGMSRSLMIMAGGIMAGLPAALGYLALLDKRRDIDSDFWARVWSGRIGKAAFGLARRLLGKAARVAPMTHRATELSLGMAAESLYDSLPSAERKALGKLPAVVQRLQEDAQRLRKLQDHIDGSAATLGADDQVLIAQRARVHEKLSDVVTSLETIRLNLLRLHAGSGVVKGLTTNIVDAAEVSAEVERMLDAQREIDRTLQFPRTIAVTPV